MQTGTRNVKHKTQKATCILSEYIKSDANCSEKLNIKLYAKWENKIRYQIICKLGQ